MTTTINGTTITLSGTYVNGSGGFAIGSKYTNFYLTSTGTIGGDGLHAQQLETVVSYGTIAATGASDGINLEDGGSVYNHKDVSGYTAAIKIAGAAGTVFNGGIVTASGYAKPGTGFGVDLAEGGYLTNTGTISGALGFFEASYSVGVEASGKPAAIKNLYGGYISGHTGVVLGDGGSVYNGANYNGKKTEILGGGIAILGEGAVYNAGEIIGQNGYGIELFNGSVTNETGGTITAVDPAISVNGGTILNLGKVTSSEKVAITATGSITNGAINDTGALIQGYAGGISAGGALTLTNFGSIDTTGTDTAAIGVYMGSGVVTNGSRIDTKAFIAGGIDGLVSSGSNSAIANFGTIRSSVSVSGGMGVRLNGTSGDVVTNGSVGDTAAVIDGYFAGVWLSGTGSIANFGTIFGSGNYGVELVANAKIVNGAAQSTSALIDGYLGGILGFGTGTIVNYGTISGMNAAINMEGGATITNGSGGDRMALVQSNLFAVELGGLGTVSNFGTLVSISSDAVFLTGGGNITNGSGVDTAATIEGYSAGIFATNATATVANFGTITIGGNGYGVNLGDGGGVTNGSVTDSGAVIVGYIAAVTAIGASTVANFGTLEGKGFDGVVSDGGRVSNGGPTNLSALIEGGYEGIRGSTGSGVISVGNFGTIIGHTGYGADLTDGGSLTNGSIQDGTALVQGDGGVAFLDGAGTIANFGTIDSADEAYAFTGILLKDGGLIINGVAGKSMGLVEGPIGVDLSGGGTTVNYGTIEGDSVAAVYAPGSATITNFGTLVGFGGAAAVKFTVSTDLLIAEAGSVFKGAVNGGGGALEVLGTGTLAGLLGAGNVTVSGSLPTPTAFSGFGTVEVGTGASFVAAGNSTIAAGKTLVVAGTLATTGTLTIAGSLAISGTLAGTGTLALAGGIVSLGNNVAYAGGFLESAGTLALGGKVLTLTGAAGFTGGTISGTGALDTKAATSVAALSFVGVAGWANYATATETGSVTLGGTGTGGSRLSNEAGAVFDITANTGIAIATGGSGNIVNVGLIEKTAGTGTSTIAAAIANNGGTIAVTSGTLDLAGALTYTGKETIGTAGTLKFDGAVGTGQAISFAGTTGGELILNDPSGTALGFSGTVSGFSGSDKLDLASFAFVTGTKPGWTQNGTSGTLTVTEGGDTAKITLFGQYVAAGFSATKDAAGDTLITYTTPAQMAALAPPHR